MTFSIKGFFIFAFSSVLFNIGLGLNGVDPDVILIVSILLGVFVGPYFLSGKIFENEEQEE